MTEIAAREIPIDDITGYPLRFVPNTDLPPVPRPGEDYDRTIANFHHPVHQRRKVEGLGLGGEAARDSCLQWASFGDHGRFHGEWPEGLTDHLPLTADEQYLMTLIGSMGYVGRKGISFAGPTPKVVSFAGTHRELLRTSGQLIIGNGGARVRRFLLEHTVQNGVSQVDPKLIDEFLRLASNPRVSPGRKLACADELLRLAIEPTTPGQLAEIYKDFRRHHLVRPGLPKQLGAFIRRQIIFEGPSVQTFVTNMRKKCEALREGELATTW